MIYTIVCGEEGIRTPGTLTRTPVFEAGSFNHSDTSPVGSANLRLKIQFATPIALLEPLGDVILRVEVVDDEADPAGAEHEDGADDLSDDGDGFLENVNDGEDGKDDTDDVDDGSHGFGLLSVKRSFAKIKKKSRHIQAHFSYLCGSQNLDPDE